VPGFQHEALIYEDAEGFLAGTVPFLREALEAGEPALVATGRSRTVLLEGELGNDAAEIRFADMEQLGRNPARIIPFWRDFVDEHGGRPVWGVGEPVWPGRGPAEIDECRRHESLLNVAFSSAPAWSLLCPYDGGSLGDDVLEKVADSHSLVVRGGVGERSTSYVAATADYFAGDLPGHPTAAGSFEFKRLQLAEVRRRVERAAKRTGLTAQRRIDLVVAVSELAANSVAHGGGAGTLHIWGEADCLFVEIEDRGLIDEPLVGRVRPSPAQQGGRGLWLANQLCDLVQIRSGPTGTRVRLRTAIG
jgi:anti-sigma regulatory factor (Ser/Thr protein kinase)